MAALVADYGSDSSLSEDDDDDNIHSEEKMCKKKNGEIPLIPADIMLEQAVHGKCNSIFANPFLEAEKSHQDSLEKHVKMTTFKELEPAQKKNLCFKFQKGKCPFGNKCKYFHPDNLQVPEGIPVTDDVKNLINENSTQKPKAKKRYGLKDTLEPPKGYIKMYKKQKNCS